MCLYCNATARAFGLRKAIDYTSPSSVGEEGTYVIRQPHSTWRRESIREEKGILTGNYSILCKLHGQLFDSMHTDLTGTIIPLLASPFYVSR